MTLGNMRGQGVLGLGNAVPLQRGAAQQGRGHVQRQLRNGQTQNCRVNVRPACVTYVPYRERRKSCAVLDFPCISVSRCWFLFLLDRPMPGHWYLGHISVVPVVFVTPCFRVERGFFLGEEGFSYFAQLNQVNHVPVLFVGAPRQIRCSIRQVFVLTSRPLAGAAGKNVSRCPTSAGPTDDARQHARGALLEPENEISA